MRTRERGLGGVKRLCQSLGKHIPVHFCCVWLWNDSESLQDTLLPLILMVDHLSGHTHQYTLTLAVSLSVSAGSTVWVPITLIISPPLLTFILYWSVLDACIHGLWCIHHCKTNSNNSKIRVMFSESAEGLVILRCRLYLLWVHVSV